MFKYENRDTKGAETKINRRNTITVLKYHYSEYLCHVNLSVDVSVVNLQLNNDLNDCSFLIGSSLFDHLSFFRLDMS